MVPYRYPADQGEAEAAVLAVAEADVDLALDFREELERVASRVRLHGSGEPYVAQRSYAS